MIQRIATISTNFDRKFYIVWPLYNWGNCLTELIPDINRVRNLGVFSGSYAHQTPTRLNNNVNTPLPVINLRIGSFITGRFVDIFGLANFIRTSLLPNYYVICGVPRNWFVPVPNGPWDRFVIDMVRNVCDMIQPWAVGQIREVFIDQSLLLESGFDFAREMGTAYQPVLYPGFARSHTGGNNNPRNNNPRLHGDFLWNQFANLRMTGIRSAMIYS